MTPSRFTTILRDTAIASAMLAALGWMATQIVLAIEAPVPVVIRERAPEAEPCRCSHTRAERPERSYTPKPSKAKAEKPAAKKRPSEWTFGREGKPSQ